MASAPTVSRIFATRYSREAVRLEQLHANHISPGTKTWADAMEAIEGRMRKVGGPIQRTACLRGMGDYLRATQKGSMHFVLGTYFTKRSSVLSFATINFGSHPLMGVSEDGVCVMQHTLTCRRDGNGHTMANQCLGYISRHAVQRLHERGHSLTIENATKMFTCVGMLGFIMGYGNKHVEATMCLHIEEMLAIGVVRQAVGIIPNRAQNTLCTFYEVRTFLPVDEILETRPAMVGQGGIAMDALTEWVKTHRDRETSEEYINRIPLIERREGEEDFVMQHAVKTSEYREGMT